MATFILKQTITKNHTLLSSRVLCEGSHKKVHNYLLKEVGENVLMYKFEVLNTNNHKGNETARFQKWIPINPGGSGSDLITIYLSIEAPGLK
jgi:hypothetical protein